MARKRIQQSSNPTRREFLWRNACAALTAAGMATTIRDLRLINAAAGANLHNTAKVKKIKNTGAEPTNYKALVCIFLFGGNDGNNMIVPNNNWSMYNSQRSNIAIAQIGQPNGLLPLSPINNDGNTYGITPAMPEIQTLFNGGQAALLFNVGTLLAKITQAQYKSGSVAVPSQLFSHNDQQIEWQTGVDNGPSPTGWGGRTADLLNSLNDANSKVSMNISVAGSNLLQTGATIQAYNVSATNGAVSLNIPTKTAGQVAQATALQQIYGYGDPFGNLIEGAYATQMSSALTAASVLTGAISKIQLPTKSLVTYNSNVWNTTFPTSSLGKQLEMIARLIQAAPATANNNNGLGHQRQVFFASAGGFDTHGAEGGYNGLQYGLLQDVSASMNALYQATAQIGVDLDVTQFTCSDFSRTLSSNASFGTDHGWGNHQIILGGSVVGNTTYGTFPTLMINGPDDTTTGRWIPTTSVDQYSATLANWFGVADANMSTVLPNIGNFSPKYLGFLG